jgi:tRNA 2-thiouridine synthesizing protein A
MTGRKVKAPKSGTRTAKAGTGPAAVNLRGLKCPLPALKTRKLLSRMSRGELLVVECTDPLAALDIPNLLRETGDKLERSGKKGRVLTFAIRKA